MARDTRRRLGVLAGAAVALLALPGIAQADVNSGFAGGDLTASSTNGDAIAITCDGGNVKINGGNPGGGPAVLCTDVVNIEVNGDAAANEITLTGVTLALFENVETVFIDGDGGNDTIRGSEFADEMHGGEGNDRILGDDNPDPARDIFLGEGGDDTLVWNPGDDSDLMEGEDGSDTIEVNGGGGAENFVVAPSATDPDRISFDRTSAPAFNLDIGTAERLDMNAGGGDDTFAANGALDALGFALDVDGGLGNDTIEGGDGADLLAGGEGNDSITPDDNPANTRDTALGGPGDDSMTWNGGDDDDINDGGDGNDTVVVNGAGGPEEFTVNASATPGHVDFARVSANPAPFKIDISTSERLDLNMNGGDDVVSSSGLVAATGLALDVDGADGNDTIDGSDAADLLSGGNGNDSITPDDNPANTLDNAQGGPGDDTMTWNGGDDDDINEGGDGNDTVQVNGATADETFTVNQSATPGRVQFNRTSTNPQAFSIDIGTSERLDLNANAGNDTVSSNGTIAPLSLDVDGADGNDVIDGGDQADLLSGGNGNDQLTPDDNPAGTRDDAQGGPGDDVMTWNPGDDDDINEGGDGNDTVVVNGASGAERFTVKPNGQRVAFDRTSPAPFNVDIGTSENLQVNAGDGGDRITGANGLAALIKSTFNGDNGNDSIKGTDGEDTLNGGGGLDVIRANDRADDQVDCGARVDVAFVDRRDSVRACEITIGGAQKVRLRGKRFDVSNGALALPVTCVAAERCRGKLTLLRGKRALGTGSFKMGRRKSATARLKLNARGRRLMEDAPARGVKLKLRIDAKDGDKNGWRTEHRVTVTP
jgi:Ca2+-binding RTX toxin-like protein